MLTLEPLVKKNFNKIRNVVRSRAFKFNIDYEELQSVVNYKLTLAINRNLFNAEFETKFWSYIQTTITNAACNIKRRPEPYFDEIDQFTDVFSSHQPDMDLKSLNKIMMTDFYERLSGNEKLVFKSHFLGGLRYEEAAADTGIGIGQLKAVIFNIRAKANRYYGKRYKLLIA